MRERILAVVGAVGLIVAAVFLRSVLAGDDPSSSSGQGGGNGGGAPVVACTPDLQSVCDALEDDGAITAAPTLELAAAASPDLEVDAWITWDPAPEVANFDLQGTWIDVEPLASAPLGVLVASGPGECGDTTSWLACVMAGAERGAPVGVGNGATAQSLARLHPVAAASVPADGDFRSDVSPLAVRTLIDSTQVRQSDYARQIRTFLTQRGALELVVGPVPALEAAAARQTSATVAVPTPAATLTVVVATYAPTGGDGVSVDQVIGSPTVRTALEGLGLEPGTGTVADTARAGEVHSLRDKVG